MRLVSVLLVAAVLRCLVEGRKLTAPAADEDPDEDEDDHNPEEEEEHTDEFDELDEMPGFLDTQTVESDDKYDAEEDFEEWDEDDVEEDTDDDIVCPKGLDRGRKCPKPCRCCDGPGKADCVICAVGYTCVDQDSDGAGFCEEGGIGDRACTQARAAYIPTIEEDEESADDLDAAEEEDEEPDSHMDFDADHDIPEREDEASEEDDSQEDDDIGDIEAEL